MNDIVECTDSGQWDDYVLSKSGHPLQLWGWGEVKAVDGWRVARLFVKNNDETVGAAQLLVKTLPWPLKALGYVPRGPVVEVEANRKMALDAIAKYTKLKFGAVAITVEPDWVEQGGLDTWRQSANTILIPKTLRLDLARSEDELLADMAKKTRQYIRKSAREDIEVRLVKGRAEIEQCLKIYHQTAARAGFSIHSDDYYHRVYDKLDDHSPVLAAFHKGEPVAFLWLAISESVAFELYGGMNDLGQSLRANYTLKWESVRLMKQWGISEYDMNGLLNDGVSDFKRGFAKHEDILVGTYDRPLSIWYFVWDKGLPLAKKIIRLIKR